VMQVLVMLSQGTRVSFDARTHRKGSRQVNRLSYHFLAAQIIDITSDKEITAQVLEHLEESLVKLETIRGQIEWTRLSQSEVTLQMVDENVRQIIINQIGQATFNALVTQPLAEYSPQDRQVVTELLGRYLQNELYRFILLRVISDQWVDYLTKVEALRVSIGLEAYAQRDPLVQYKTQATEMFQVLLADIRLGVVSRIFTSQVRRGPTVDQNQQQGSEQPSQAQSSAPQAGNSDNASPDRKKKRHRH